MQATDKDVQKEALFTEVSDAESSSVSGGRYRGYYGYRRPYYYGGYGYYRPVAYYGGYYRPVAYYGGCRRAYYY